MIAQRPFYLGHVALASGGLFSMAAAPCRRFATDDWTELWYARRAGTKGDIPVDPAERPASQPG